MHQRSMDASSQGSFVYVSQGALRYLIIGRIFHCLKIRLDAVVSADSDEYYVLEITSIIATKSLDFAMVVHNRYEPVNVC